MISKKPKFTMTIVVKKKILMKSFSVRIAWIKLGLIRNLRRYALDKPIAQFL